MPPQATRRINISITSDLADLESARPPNLAPLQITVPLDDAEALWDFVACLATKGDVLIPAVMAIIACAQGSAPPPRNR